jgi:peptidoglycan/xylan/chitin deacetylase (PgdA/CDA1 family)
MTARAARDPRRRLRELAYRVSPVRSGLDAPGVALTFDDGPDPVFTPRVLDVLAEEQVRATFFVVGKRVVRHPELVRRIVAEGHAIGSHSFSHVDAGMLSWLQLLRDYRAGRRAVEQAVGRRVRLFRPPQGHYSGQSAIAVRIAGLRPWLWTIDAEDWRPGTTPDELLARARSLAAGDVLLLHDAMELPLAPEAEDRSATVAALLEVIERVRERGLEFVTLTDPPARYGARGAPAAIGR